MIKKILKAVKERVLIYRIKRYLHLKLGIKKELQDYSIGIYEEAILYKLLDCFKIDSFFQIGIGDPDLLRDPFYNYLKRKKINGVVVEPHPTLYKKLEKYYRHDIKLNCLVDSKDEIKRNFFFVGQKYLNLYEDYVKTISTTNKDHLINFKVLPDHILNIPLSTKTIKKIMEENNIRKFDILLIDVEGAEFDIIKSFLIDSSFKPLIIFEWRHIPKKKLLELLEYMEQEFGYKFVIFQNDILCYLKLS
jgi:FkbM family methyltransferase